MSILTLDDQRKLHKSRSQSTSGRFTQSSNADVWQNFLSLSKIEFEERYHQNHSAADLTIEDFDLIATIGEGSFGTVVLAKISNGDEYYAIKIIEKARIVKSRQVEQTYSEKRLLLSVRFPFIVSIDRYFKDNVYIFFVMPYMIGGDLFSILRKTGKFDERRSAFYATQVILALEYLHYVNVAYRDLKPENLMLDEEGYIKIIDLGFAKIITKRTYTLCGTPDYLAPELILSKGYSHAIDWWALGVLIYEMCCGIPPFFAKDVSQTYELIVNRVLQYPFGFSDPLKDILEKLLQVDVTHRLGNLMGGVNDIKEHSWFSAIKWMDIYQRRVKPPYIPRVRNKADTRNFEELGEIVLKQLPKDPYSQQFDKYF